MRTINKTQREVLYGFIGNEGIYFQTICDYDGIDWGTKALYLERAITQSCHSFLESLDKLYQPNLINLAKKAHLELIRSLKIINDLCFNNTVKYVTYTGKVFNREALKHYFGNMGELTTEIIEDLKTSIQATIWPKIAALCAAHPELVEQRKTRITVENDIQRQTRWRNICDLPQDQLEITGSSFHSSIIPPLPSTRQPEMFPQEQQEFVARITAGLFLGRRLQATNTPRHDRRPFPTAEPTMERVQFQQTMPNVNNGYVSNLFRIPGNNYPTSQPAELPTNDQEGRDRDNSLNHRNPRYHEFFIRPGMIGAAMDIASASSSVLPKKDR